VVDFLETLEDVEDSSLNVILGRSRCGREVRAVQSVGRLLGNGEGRSGARQTTQCYTGERHFDVNAFDTGVFLRYVVRISPKHAPSREESHFVLAHLKAFQYRVQMKHGVAFRKFSRTSSHRNLMLRCAALLLFAPILILPVQKPRQLVVRTRADSNHAPKGQGYRETGGEGTKSESLYATV